MIVPMTIEPLGETGGSEVRQGWQRFAPWGSPVKVFAAVLASTHAPLLALLAHRVLSSAAGSAPRTTDSALAFTAGATVLGSAVTVRDLGHPDRALRSLREGYNGDPLTGVYNRRAGRRRSSSTRPARSKSGWFPSPTPPVALRSPRIFSVRPSAPAWCSASPATSRAVAPPEPTPCSTPRKTGRRRQERPRDQPGGRPCGFRRPSPPLHIYIIL